MIVLAVYVVDDDPDAMGRHRQPVLAAQRALCVFIAALPVLAHGGAGEFVVLGMPLIRLLLIDQVKDRDLGHVGEIVLELTLLVRKPLLGNLVERKVQALLPGVNAPVTSVL